MSDDLGKKIKQITDMLSQEDIPDNLKGIFSLLGGQSASEDTTPKAKEQKDTKPEKPESSEGADNAEMLSKVMRVMNNMNLENDPRVSLLSALKPFLNNRRQSNINNCINIIRMSKLAGIVDDNNKGNF